MTKVNKARNTRIALKRGRHQMTPEEAGCHFYRGYIYHRRSPHSERCNLWSPDGRFICSLSLRLLPRYVDKSIKFGWDDRFIPSAPAGSETFEQLQLI